MFEDPAIWYFSNSVELLSFKKENFEHSVFHFTLIFILKVYTALNYCILCLLCLWVSKYLYSIETKPFSCTVCEVNFTEIQSLVSHFDQYHAFEKRNEDHVNQKTESGGKKKMSTL